MERYDGSRAEQVNDPFVSSSVNPIKSSEIWAAVNDNKLCDIWNACQLDVDLFERSFNDPSFDFSLLNQDNEFSEIAKAPHDFNLNKYFPHKLAHVLIDLNATDEQIKKDFDQILMQYRIKFSSEHPKKIFTRTDFDYWIEYSVIPYLDLMIISKLTGKKITQSKIAKLVFPNEYDVDVTERLRKVTKPTAKWLIDNQIYSTISSQLFYKKLIGTKKD